VNGIAVKEHGLICTYTTRDEVLDRKPRDEIFQTFWRHEK
jgi:hypothetical protein